MVRASRVPIIGDLCGQLTVIDEQMRKREANMRDAYREIREAHTAHYKPKAVCLCLVGREGESKQDMCCMKGINCLESSFSEILPASYGYCMSWLLICSRSIGMSSVLRFWAY